MTQNENKLTQSSDEMAVIVGNAIYALIAAWERNERTETLIDFLQGAADVMYNASIEEALAVDPDSQDPFIPSESPPPIGDAESPF